MGLITGQIPSMIQGISQQAPELRLPTQGEVQINGLSDPVYGLGPRIGSNHIKLMAGVGTASTTWASWISRDDREKYVVVFDGTGIRVFGLDGYEFHVENSAGTLAYLNTPNPRRDLMSLTIADTTLILNRTKTVAMDSTSATAALSYKAIVSVLSGNYEQKYTIEVGGKTYSVTTSDTDPGTLQTSYIADALSDAWDGDPASGYTKAYTAGDSHLTVVKNDGTDFTIKVTDSVGNTALSLVKNQASAFDLLPPVAPDGYLALVAGDPESSADDYWVEFDASTGQWVEAPGPGVAVSFDAATMPHSLTRQADDVYGTITGTPYGIYFEYDTVDWNDRLVGDTSTVPAPAFVGTTIASLLLHENRFGFLLKSGLILSRAGDFYNFWRRSASRVYADDTIDITVAVSRLADDRVLDLQHALSFNEQLLLVGDRAQVVVYATDALTPDTIRATLSTSLEASRYCRPIVVGGSAFIPYTDGQLVGLREFFIAGSDRTKDSDIASKHVPRLMQGNPWHLTACTSTPTLFMATDATRYLYQFRHTVVNNQRVQAAWSVWDFGSPVISFEVLGSTLWMIVSRPEGACLESVEIPPLAQTETEAMCPILLDRKTPAGTAQMIGHVTPRTGSSTSGAGPGGGGGGGDSGSAALLSSDSGSGGGTAPSGEESHIPAGGDGEVAGDDGGGGGTGDEPEGTSTGDAGINSARDRAFCVYDSTSDTTTITLPWEPGAATVVVRADTMSALTWTAGSTSYEMVIRGAVCGYPLYIGNRFTFRYRFSPAQVTRQTDSGGTTVVRTGRLQVLRWTVNVNNGGPFDMQVTLDQRDPSTKTIRPRSVGHSTDLLQSYQGSVFVLSRADRARVDLVSTNFLPVWFVSAEWSGEYTNDRQAM